MLEINSSLLITDYNRSYRLHNDGTIWSNRCCKYIKPINSYGTKYRLYRSKTDYDEIYIKTLMDEYYPSLKHNENIQTEVQ